MSKAKDLLETVKYMIIQNGFDSVPLSLFKKAIDASIAELQAQEAKSCEWKYFEENDSWIGDCGAEWTFFDGTPLENGMKFCVNCGKNLVEKDS